MKLCTYFTPSHETMFRDFFEPSTNEFDLVVRRGPQYGNGNIATPGFKQSIRKKVQFIHETIEENIGDVVLISDVDLIFLGPVRRRLLELTEGYDLATSMDNRTLCTGFMAIRCSPKTASLWELFVRDPKKLITRHRLSEQALLNQHKNKVHWRGLPFEEFWNIGQAGRKVWKGAEEQLRSVTVPRSTRVFHANFCIGIKQKMRLLHRVQQIASQPPEACRLLFPGIMEKH